MKVHGEHAGRVEKVSHAILQYLRLHPMAKDSLEGVARWWVGEEKTIVREALEALVRKGLCKKIRNHYCSITISSSGTV
jgi:hypothetical protein